MFSTLLHQPKLSCSSIKCGRSEPQRPCCIITIIICFTDRSLKSFALTRKERGPIASNKSPSGFYSHNRSDLWESLLSGGVTFPQLAQICERYLGKRKYGQSSSVRMIKIEEPTTNQEIPVRTNQSYPQKKIVFCARNFKKFVRKLANSP